MYRIREIIIYCRCPKQRQFYNTDMIKNLSGIEVDVVKRKVKYVRIKISREGKVSLIIPKSIPEKVGEEFFAKKIDWVRGKLALKLTKTTFEYKSGQKFYLFGEPCVLRVEKSFKNGFCLLDGELLLRVKSDGEEAIKTYFYATLKRLLLEKSKPYFDKWERETGLKHSKITIRKTVSRWGSCNSESGSINLSLYLVNLPEFCLDYVVLHELCHLKYANHGEGFKNMLTRYFKGWEKVRKYMRENGNKLKINDF